MSENFWAQKGSIHWQTPREITDLVDMVFPHGVGLDPCAGKGTSIGTTNWRLSDGDNALRDSWRDGWLINEQPRSSFFINPPFGVSYVKDKICISAKQYKDLVEDLNVPLEQKQGWVKQTIKMFADKVATEVENGMSGIWLSKGAMESKAIQKLLTIPGALICHPDHRINYKDPETGKVAKGVNFNSVVLGFFAGPDLRGWRANFIENFSKLGTILTKV